MPEFGFSEFPVSAAPHGKCDSHYISDRVLDTAPHHVNSLSQTRKLKVDLGNAQSFFPFSLPSWIVNKRFSGFYNLYNREGEIRIPQFIVKLCLCVLLLEVMEKF